MKLKFSFDTDSKAIAFVRPEISSVLSVLFLFFSVLFKFIEVNRGAVAQSVTVNRLDVGSNPTRGDEIFT